MHVLSMKTDLLHELPQLLRNNLELLSGVILSQRNHDLTIQRVKKEDSGLYTCTACNSRGCDTAQAFLTTEGQSLPVSWQMMLIITEILQCIMM